VPETFKLLDSLLEKRPFPVAAVLLNQDQTDVTCMRLYQSKGTNFEARIEKGATMPSQKHVWKVRDPCTPRTRCPL
jgi:hypothetical protein